MQFFGVRLWVFGNGHAIMGHWVLEHGYSTSNTSGYLPNNDMNQDKVFGDANSQLASSN